MLLPTTVRGRRSIRSAAAFVVCIAIFVLAITAGQRGGDEFFTNLWLAVPGLGAYLAAVAAFVFGALAIVVSGERSVTVIATTALALLIVSFGVLEVAFPH